ncbi:hypothetical protein Mapa_006874 [Marchantia paleacea]|nr:hypothetical protein Mapa_006874 [Marchantia paleacea]
MSGFECYEGQSPPDSTVMALVPAQSNANKGKEKRIRAENWTWEETVRLVEAKKREWEEKENGSLLKFTSTTDKWTKVQEYMKESSLFRARSVEQIRQKWEALYNSWKKIKVSNSEAGSGEYWMMSKEEKNEKRLPTSFDRRLWDMLNSFLGQKNVNRNTKCFDTMCEGAPSGNLHDVHKSYVDPLVEELNDANRTALSDDVSTNPAERGDNGLRSGRRPFGEGDLLRGNMGKRRKSRGPDAFLELLKESNKSIVEALSVQRDDKREELKLVLALEERKLQIEERKLELETRDRESMCKDREKIANAMCSIIEVLDKLANKI